MKHNNIIREKSYAFAIKIGKLYRVLVEQHKEFILSKQLVRSGSSIGANIEEAIGASSKKDFAAKLAIAYKEARETRYWLNLLTDINYITKDYAAILLKDLEELLKIIGSIQITLNKQNNNT